jgi:hypothetical protein
VADGVVYAATAGGLSISTDGGLRFVNRTVANGLGSNLVRSVYVTNALVYAATAGGLSISTDGGLSFINKTTLDGLAGNSVKSAFASGGRIYAALGAGLSVARTSISGKVGMPGVTLSYYNDGPQVAISDANGNYTIDVPYNWSGAVTPWLAEYTFHPSRSYYTNVTASYTGQNYAAAANAAPAPSQQNEPSLDESMRLSIMACGIEAGDCDQRYDRKKIPLSPYASWAISREYETHYFGVDRYNLRNFGTGSAKRKMALDILGDLRAAPGYVYLVGHSAGADAVILAADMALSEGLGVKIKGVVLLDPYFYADGVSLQKPADRVAAGLKGRVFLGKSIGYRHTIGEAIERLYQDEHRPLSYDQNVLKDILQLMPDWK